MGSGAKMGSSAKTGSDIELSGAGTSGELEVAELLLTAEIYNRSENLTEDDLPPKIRKHYFDPASSPSSSPKATSRKSTAFQASGRRRGAFPSSTERGFETS